MWHHGMVHALLNTHLPSLDSPIAMEEQQPSLETGIRHTGDRPKFSARSSWKQPQKRPFLDTKSAVELKMARNLFVVMRACSLIILSYVDTCFEPRCGGRDFWIAC